MKRLKLLLAGGILAFALCFPVLIGAPVSAIELDAAPVRCPTFDQEFSSDNTENCDLSVDKQVSVNGGSFADADTSAAAVTAHIGDTITWKITLSNQSAADLTPFGQVTVHDVVPAGVSFVSAVASAGSYDNVATNDWVVFLAQSLPATLTITTTANTTGLIQNTAALSDYDPCIDGCLGNVGAYSDANTINNSNDAWVNVQTAPQVLGESTINSPQVLAAGTLANTGTGLIASLAAALIILATIAVAAYGRLFRKPAADR